MSSVCQPSFTIPGEVVLVSIEVTPANPNISVSDTQQFTATGHYSDSSTQDITATSTWMSATPGIATIDSSGLATGVSQGSSVITATKDSISGDTTLGVDFTCGVTPDSIQDAIWTQDVTGAQPPCGVFAITAGIGNFQLTYNLTTCIDGFILISAPICNPGAAYDITVTIPWDDSGNVVAGTHEIEFDLNIDVPTVDSATRDLVTGPFTDVVLTGTIPAMTTSTLSLRIVMNASPDPEVEAHNTGNITITPLTPP